MNIQKKTYTISVKGTRNFQSVSLTEGFEISMDNTYNEFEFEAHKQMVKDKLIEETKTYLDNFVDSISVNI